MSVGEVRPTDARPSGLRLVVDCGSVWTRAALGWPGGQGRLLSFGALPGLPSGVAVRADGSVVVGVEPVQPAEGGPTPEGGWDGVVSPVDHLGDAPLTFGAATGPLAAVDLLAAVLRQVVAEAATTAGQAPDGVCLVVPGTWGPNRKTLLRQSARRAGIGEVTFTEVPVAVAHRLDLLGLGGPVGSWIAVCDVGAGFEASVVARTVDGFEVLSTMDAPAGGDAVDEAFAQRLLQIAAGAVGAPLPGEVTSADGAVLRRYARAGKEALTVAASTMVTLPPPYPAAVVGPAELAAAAGPVVDAAVVLTRQAIDAAMVEPPWCTGLFLVGGGAVAPVVVEGFSRGLSEVGPVRVVPRPEVAAVLGAAGVLGDGGGAVPDPPAAPAPPRAMRAVGLFAPGVAALLLAAHFFATARVEESAGLTRSVYVIASWGELALACLCGLLGCLSGATIVASALPSPDPTARRSGLRLLQPAAAPSRALVRAADAGLPAIGRSGAGGSSPAGGGVEPAAVLARQVATGLLAATALGLTGAGLLAVFGGVISGAANSSYLRWAVLPLLPVATAAVLCAVVLGWRRVTPVEGWHAWLVFPISSLLCAAAGMVVLQQAMVMPVYPGDGPFVTILAHLGGAVIGVGAALAVASSSRWRVILAGPFAVAVAGVVSYPTVGFVAVLYVIAASLWWWRRLWQLLRAVLPTVRIGG